ncbi:hypothetical protein FOVG_10167 [Fusarium oxysporum f. sp. pisi HDV247]|uniref:Uncharacterized protein n=1 Tax=Fusarium oxysporum f. sp. pisi HDV247 TaxID=1080344 RepID=W9NZ92_FUSOX|nr:hypothetical protein FOVG_10167 [Fusarium oxysporum f. sp. pisi HDV247]
MSRAPVPLNGPYHHEETPRRDIAATKVKMAKAKYLVAELKQNARAGSDDAAEAGFNPENRSEAMMLANECQAVIDVARPLQAEIYESVAAIRDLERIKATQPPPADAPDLPLRREASAQVFKFVTNSGDRLHTLVQEIGYQITPENRNAVNEILAQATDSQTKRWIHGAQQTPQLAVLQQTIEERDTELSVLKEEVERKKQVAFQYQRDRHQAETNLLAERAKIATYEKNASRAKRELERAKERIGTLEDELQIIKLRKDGIETHLTWYKQQSGHKVAQRDEEVRRLTQQVQDLDEASRDLEDEKETLADQLLQRDQSIDTLREQKLVLEERLASDADHDRAGKAVLEDELKTSKVDLEKAQKEGKDISQKLDQAKERIQAVEFELVAVRKDLAEGMQEAEKAQGAHSKLKATISDQRALLDEQDGEIRRLNGLLAARDKTVDSQVEQASIFLRRMSLNVESDIWRSVAEGVLGDSTVAPTAQIPWQPWRALPSWSHDEALNVREDDRSIHAAALDILAVMGVPSAPAESLLSRLQSLQDMLVDTSPLVSTVSQLLLRSLAGAVGDERLHLMHHVLICQIVDLLNRDAVEPVEVSLDSRATTLVSALKAWEAQSAAGLQMAGSLSYPDLAFVGFNHSPPGILAVNPLNRELRWIDKAQANNALTHIELVSEQGGPMVMALPLDTRERQLWSVAHL